MSDITSEDQGYLAAASALGTEHGKNAGSWVIDGNTSTATALEILNKIEECEFDIPAPLSGEFADGMTLGRLADELGVDEDSDDMDDIASHYEDAYYQAYQAEVERSAAASLGFPCQEG